MKNVNAMTRKELDALPHRDWDADIGEFDSLIILPLRTKHDSGYRCMDFVAVRNGSPLCRLSGHSDVIHLNGIGGFGHNWVEKYGKCPDKIPPVGFNIDCLPKSGLLQIFCGRKMIVGNALSSFELYAKEAKP